MLQWSAKGVLNSVSLIIHPSEEHKTPSPLSKEKMGEARIGHIAEHCKLVAYFNKWRPNCLDMYILDSLLVLEIMFGGLIQFEFIWNNFFLSADIN